MINCKGALSTMRVKNKYGDETAVGCTRGVELC